MVHRPTRRRIATIAVGVALVATVLTAGPAWAHVEIAPESLPRGSSGTFAFRVPNEKADASTVKLEVSFPTKNPIADVLVQQKPGWTYTVETTHLKKPIKTDDGTFSDAVTKITWSGGQILPGGYDVFPVLGGPLPTNTGKLVFKALQTYSNGEIVRWIQTPVKGAPEPENPAPTLTLTKADKAHGH